MPSCIICHLQIDESTDSHFKCNYGHPVHNKCLAEWLLSSHDCPLCSEPYSQDVMDHFKDFFDQIEKEKQETLEKEKRRESVKEVERVANKIVFLKFIESVEKLIEEKKFDDAVEKLMESYNETVFDDKNLQILFLLGKTNYLKGKYDLSINFLFKLVKIRYDYPDGFLYLGKSYEALGMKDKAQWAYERIKE